MAAKGVVREVAKEAVWAMVRLTEIVIRSPHISDPARASMLDPAAVAAWGGIMVLAAEPAWADMLGLVVVAAWVSITALAVGPAWGVANRCRWKSAGVAVATAVGHAAGLRTRYAAEVAAGQLSSLTT